ncbi:RNA polymerase sigma factor [Christensenellaceae bacterium OttesenSCG-928-L17]|nr:RNA polymerase sigma factor [Christensenellaceae bacterium OttesenSCG-928-L17]
MFNQYLEQYGNRIYALCLKLQGGRKEEADDLYQETWLNAYRGFSSYRRDEAFLAWVTKICVNAYRDMLRKQKRHAAHRYTGGQEPQAVLESIPAKSEDEAHLAVRDAVEKLPETLKICITLYYFFGSSVEETAATLRIPQGTVKSRLSRARTLLKEELEQE